MDCERCRVYACRDEEKAHQPKFCPMDDEELYEKAFAEIMKEENHAFYIESAKIEADGYGEWSRVKETIEFCKRLGFKKIGLAFCSGLRKEASILAEIFRKNDLNLVSIMCKTGGIPKEKAGLKDEEKVRPGTYEVICNPVAQAMFLNKEKTDFNIVLGLCVGHDSMFYKYSEAMVTTIVVKDRALAHNPVGALY
ncbi:MAG: DUF1847 domain-containing protein, partial [Tissierellia bacterium]|nr:DUF1847 domain-containing protein [Tissierellia bacterium]